MYTYNETDASLNLTVHDDRDCLQNGNSFNNNVAHHSRWLHCITSY